MISYFLNLFDKNNIMVNSINVFQGKKEYLLNIFIFLTCKGLAIPLFINFNPLGFYYYVLRSSQEKLANLQLFILSCCLFNPIFFRIKARES